MPEVPCYQARNAALCVRGAGEGIGNLGDSVWGLRIVRRSARARRLFDARHALDNVQALKASLRDAILFLRTNPALETPGYFSNVPSGTKSRSAIVESIFPSASKLEMRSTN